MSLGLALIGLGAGLFADLAAAQASSPKVVYKKKVDANYNACTIPPRAIYINESQKENQMLHKHELVHWQQYKRNGLIGYYSRYFLEQLINGYDKNIFEVEARIKSGERKECIYNYTESVRNGSALTVHNPNFRK